MKLSKRNIFHLCLLTGIYLVFVLLLTRFEYAYGSELDWGGQHYAIPDYFRKLFYKTGDIFPSFAPNIGGGENIYNLSYYGLYSPIIMFSYLLPFVKMSTYIQAVSIIGIIVSVIIFYLWMRKKFTDSAAFALSFVFLFSAPLIFHSHRHIMFVNYMPFLLLGFMAVEDYFEGKRKYMVTLWAFLMIMTSYFFAVSGLAAMAVYGVYRWLKITEKPTVKGFCSAAWRFALRLVLAVLMACVLIMPTLFCMLNGRDKGNSSIDFTSFIPGVNLKFLLYSHYSMGLCLFTVMSIISALFSKQRCQRFLGIIMTLLATCPVIIYMLNGTLYVDPKVLIPFLPLGMLLFGHAYFDIIRGKMRLKPIFAITVAVAVLGLLYFKTSQKVEFYVIVDLIALTASLTVYHKVKKDYILNIGMSFCLLMSTVYINFSDDLVLLSQLDYDNSAEINAIADYIAEDEQIVRTSNCVDEKNTVNMIYNADYYTNTIYSSLHNKNYNRFYFSEIYNENQFRNTALTAQSHSVISDIYFSNRYLITDDANNAVSGYKKISECGNLSLYENKDVLPFGYATSDIISEADYKSLSYPYSVEALLNNIVVDEGESKEYSTGIDRVKAIKFDICEQIEYRDGKYIVDTSKTITQKVKLPQTLTKDEIMFMSFKVNNNIKGGKKDASVIVNSDKNTLTAPTWKYYNNNKSFEYVITCGQGYSTDYLTVKFLKGKYEITNIKCYVINKSDITGDVDPFYIDKENSGGDVISGSVDVASDGYFTISIPYTNGFDITVDGESVECEKVDTAFVGFKISEGKHNIKITFTAPFLHLGIVCSAAGAVMFILSVIFDIRRKSKSDR